MNLLNTQKSSSSSFGTSTKMSCSWILDTGCSHHMSGGRDFLNVLKSTIPYNIKFSNGTSTTAVLDGFAYLNSNFKINYVLYILNLHYNLFFISQLVKDHKCSVTY